MNSIARFSNHRLHGEQQVYDIGGCIANLIVPMQRLNDVSKHTLHKDIDKICNGYGFRPKNVTDALVIHIKASSSSHLNSIGEITPCMRSSTVTRFVKFFIAALYREIPSETDIICILARITTWLHSLDSSMSKPCIFIGCEQGLNRTGYIVVNLLVRMYNLPVMEALKRFRHVRPPGITKSHFITSLFRRFESGNVSVVKCLPPVFFSHKQLMRITGRHMVESRRLHNPLPTSFTRFTEHTAFEALMRDKPNKVIASFLQNYLRDIVDNMYTLESGQHADIFTKRFYMGLTKPIPCDQKTGNEIIQAPSDWAVSLKADGVHVCILCTPIATFLLERGKHTSPPVTLPFIWRNTHNIGLECTLIEGERVNDALWVYDILYSKDLAVGKKTPFRARYNKLIGLYRHNPTKDVRIKPFKRISSQLTLASLYFPEMPPTDGLIIYSRESTPTDAVVYKIKEHHTVELQVSERTCYARNSQGALEQLPFDLVSDYTVITTIDATNGLWECKPVVQKSFIMFHPIKLRMDTNEPNLIEPTITSCIEMTINPFYPNDLLRSRGI